MSGFLESFRKAIFERSLDELAIGWLRYEAIRKLNPHQFTDLHKRNLAGENFDAMVDQLVAEKNKTVAQLGMNTSEAKARESASLSFQGDACSNPASLTTKLNQ